MLHLAYDITSEPIAWSSLYLLWLITLIAAFIFGIIGLGNPTSDGTPRGHRITYFVAAGLVSAIAVIGTIVGFTNRSSCNALAERASSVEGRLQNVVRGRSSMTHYRFQVGNQKFNTEPPLFSACGFVRSVADVTSLNEGEYVRIKYDGSRILKVWKREP